jgi:hypothetical protein
VVLVLVSEKSFSKKRRKKWKTQQIAQSDARSAGRTLGMLWHSSLYFLSLSQASEQSGAQSKPLSQ